MSLRSQLEQFLGIKGGRRVAILGIGSPIRGDDAVGVAVVERLEARGLENVLLLKTETVPESFTGLIRRFNPTHVLMIDAAHLGDKPGAARIIPTQRITGEIISTHHLPLTELSNFIRGTMDAKVALLGIQPESIAVGTEMTPALREAANRIADEIYGFLVENS